MKHLTAFTTALFFIMSITAFIFGDYATSLFVLSNALMSSVAFRYIKQSHEWEDSFKKVARQHLELMMEIIIGENKPDTKKDPQPQQPKAAPKKRGTKTKKKA